jgi:hypothetical protein
VIAFVCTNRDRHPRWFIATVDPDDPMRPTRDRRRETQEEVRKSSSTTGRAGYDPTYPSAYRLECTHPDCPRNLELGPDRWRTLVAGLAERNLTRCDVSYLPY